MSAITEKSYLSVDGDTREIALHIQINTELCPVMDYFEIYFKRMQLCRRAADFFSRAGASPESPWTARLFARDREFPEKNEKIWIFFSKCGKKRFLKVYIEI